MKATAEKLEKNQVMLEIEVDNETYNKAMNKASKKIAGMVNIPGFRKGKAPKIIVERYVGQEAILKEAVEDMFPEIYENAIKETGIVPVGQPEMEDLQNEEGKPLVIKVKVAVKPEVKLGEYKGFEVEKASVAVSDEELNVEMEKMQNRYARLLTIDEGELIDHDTAVINFEGYADGKPFEGGKAENYSLEIGSGSFIPGFEEQMQGMKVGEEREITVTFPEEYQEATLAGKEAMFKVALLTIKRKELSALDDEFAKDVSEFDTLEELKTDLLNKLKAAKEERADAEVSRKVVEKAVEKAEMDIPEPMIEKQLDDMLYSMDSRLRTQGIELKQYLQYTNTSLEDLRGKMKGDAEKTVRRNLTLDEIAKAEGLIAADEEVTEEINKVAAQYQQEPAKLKASMEAAGELELIKEDILRRKAVDFVTAEAKIVVAK